MQNISKMPKFGERGEHIRTYQRALFSKGFDPGAIDGIFGNNTLSAGSRFQKSRGLTGTGHPGPKTLALLELEIGSENVYELISSGQDADEGTLPWYKRMLEGVLIHPDHLKLVGNVADRLAVTKARYEAVAQSVWGAKTLWWVVAGIHYKEASGSFQGVLHNGQKIIGTGKKTTIVPVGRGPFKTWEEAAIDALKGHSIGKMTAKDPLEQILYYLERYNGTGYISGKGKVDTSPYLWAMTNVNDGTGRFTSDGSYDRNAPNTSSPGIVAILVHWSNSGVLKYKFKPSFVKAKAIVSEVPKAESKAKATRDEVASMIIAIVQKDIDNKLRETHGSNRSPRIDEFNTRAKSYLGAPYCASGLWCAVDDVCKALGWKNPLNPTASSQMFRNTSYVPAKYIKRGVLLGNKGDFGVLTRSSNVAQGHLTVLTANQSARPYFKTAEYNTNEAGSRDGDGAYNKTRSTDAKGSLVFNCFTDIPQYLVDSN